MALPVTFDKNPAFLIRCCILLLVLLAGLTRAQPSAPPMPGAGVVVASPVETLADSTGQRTIGQMVALYRARQFRPLPTNRLHLNHALAPQWLHLRLPPAADRLAYVELDNPRINQVDFYQVVGNRLIRRVITGDSLPFSTRVFPHYSFVFPVLTNPQTPTDVFVRLAKHGEVLSATLRLWKPNAFHAHDRRQYLGWGMLTGLTALVLLLTGMVWLATANALYGWFVAVIGWQAVHLGAASGLGFQYGWPDWPIVNDWYPQTLSAWLIVASQVQFMQRFIGQTAQNSRVYRWVNGFTYSIVGATAITVGLLLFRAVPAGYFTGLMVVSVLFSLGVLPLVWASMRERIGHREPVILFYAAITGMQFLALLLYLLNVVATGLGHPLFTFTDEGLVTVNFLIDLLLLSLGVVYFGFSNYRQQNEHLLTALHRQEQTQSARLIEALEIERGRMAEDLYDDVGAMLSTAIGYISSVLRQPDMRERFPMLTDARQLLVRAVDNLRAVSHNLMPKNFAELGLARSLAETIDKVSASTDITFRYIVTGTERRLSASTEVQIFRVAAELINDIVKNSNATHATFQLIYGPESLTLLSEDDGPNPPQYNNLHSKVAFINGTINADVSPDGVTVLAEIPYH